MTLSSPFPRLLNVGLSGVLVTFCSHLTDPANRAALAFRACVDAANIPGVLETSTSLTSTFVSFDLVIISNDALREQLLDLLAQQDWGSTKLTAQRRLWHIPTAFGGENGPELAEVANFTGLSVAAVIAMIEATPLRVLTIGFAPGQPYLGLLPERWDVPRQSALTTSVPEGALVTAIRQLIVFTAGTPTGWRHIGQTAFRGFRPESDTPFALRPGDELQFAAISGAELDQIRMRDTSGNGGAEIKDIS